MANSNIRSYINKTKLRAVLAVFFIALGTPALVLIQQAYSQLKWEAFYQHRLLAEELTDRIDKQLNALIENEETRPFTDYSFLNVTGDSQTNFLQRSPISAFPISSSIPGIIGYFQVNNDQQFSSPLLPVDGSNAAAYGIPANQIPQRQALQNQIMQILNRNRLVKSATDKEHTPANANLSASASPNLELSELTSADTIKQPFTDAEESSSNQSGFSGFDQLNKLARRRQSKKDAGNNLGRVEDLKLDSSYQLQSLEQGPASKPALKSIKRSDRSARKERFALPETLALSSPTEKPTKQSQVKISIFESEIDPFELNLLDSGHFVLYRKVWRNNQRYIQGALIEQTPFLKNIIASAFRETALSNMTNLIVAYQGDILSAFSNSNDKRYLSNPENLSGTVLYQSKLSPPWNDLQLIFNITHLSTGPGGTVIAWVALILMMVLLGGTYLMYRLGLRQIELAQQQQDFVSSVSHELKTPLTSIRMYGEMLREGWASDDKKQTYYDFIFDESERLSRLIENVLQFARMNRRDLRLELKPVNVAQLLDNIASKISTQIERANFEISLQNDIESSRTTINVDIDAFIQIIINLIDNAIKFSKNADRKRIEINAQILPNKKVIFSIRDHGPGISRNQMKKIFLLFYRTENELTRETSGTGIGLALVRELTQAMHGKIDVVNKQPGAEFRVTFPMGKQAHH